MPPCSTATAIVIAQALGPLPFPELRMITASTPNPKPDLRMITAGMFSSGTLPT